MEADVVYDRRLMVRSMTSAHAECLFPDRRVDPGEAPVKVCAPARTPILPDVVTLTRLAAGVGTPPFPIWVVVRSRSNLSPLAHGREVS